MQPSMPHRPRLRMLSRRTMLHVSRQQCGPPGEEDETIGTLRDMPTYWMAPSAL